MQCNAMQTNVIIDNWTVFTEIECNKISSIEALSYIANEYVNITYSIDSYLSKDEKDFQFGYLCICARDNEKRHREKELFMELLTHDEFDSKVVNFITNVIEWSVINNRSLWTDDEHQLGETAAYLLAMKNPKYINLYTRLLLVNDLYHEVYQEEHIDEILDKYGFIPSTIRLLAYRATSAYGQLGDCQISQKR